MEWYVAVEVRIFRYTPVDRELLAFQVTRNETMVSYGLSLADTAAAVYSMAPTGLGGEFVSWTTDCDGWADDCLSNNNSVRVSDGRFRLRPEVLETWYHAYRATRNPKYRDWAWTAFEAINKFCRTDAGYSGLSNVMLANGGIQTDVQESFIFAEVLKYLYLIHSEVSR